jgi:predicted porin
MHGKVLAGSLMLASVTAYAQSVTIYGIVDTSVEHLTNVSASGDSLTRMPTLTGLMPSRLGFRGSEDLGDGLQAFFNLEMGIATATGSLNNGGRAFGRASNVGIAGPWGRLTFGRQQNMTVQAISTHVTGPALYSIGSQDTYLPNAFSDNAVGYLGTFGAWTVGATYSLGRDSAAGTIPSATNCPGELASDKKACRQWTAAVRYDASDWGAAVSRDQMRGGPNAALGLSSSAYTDTRSIVSGWVKLGPAKVSGGVLHRDRETDTSRKSNLYYVGASYPVTAALSLDGEISRTDVKNSPDDANMFVARAVYYLSKRTAVFAMAGHIENSGTSALSLSAGGTVAPGMSQSGIAAGVHHKF